MVRERLADYELVVVGDGHGSGRCRGHSGGAITSVGPRARGGPWRVDVFREPWDGDVWMCRRDSRFGSGATRLISRSREGIPYAAPEVVLLFKAKATVLRTTRTS